MHFASGAPVAVQTLELGFGPFMKVIDFCLRFQMVPESPQKELSVCHVDPRVGAIAPVKSHIQNFMRLQDLIRTFFLASGVPKLALEHQLTDTPLFLELIDIGALELDVPWQFRPLRRKKELSSLIIRYNPTHPKLSFGAQLRTRASPKSPSKTQADRAKQTQEREKHSAVSRERKPGPKKKTGKKKQPISRERNKRGGFLERESKRGRAMVQIARRKKGRPSKADLARRSAESPAASASSAAAAAAASASSQPDLRRSIRRRNVRYNIIDYDDDYIDDEEDERRREKKKLKLMAKLNQAEKEEEEEEERDEDKEAPPQEAEDDKENEHEEENEDAEDVHEEDEEDVAKGRKVELKGLHAVSVSGAPVILPSGIPLPDKRTLELILDKLQKYVFSVPNFQCFSGLVFSSSWKDTYGVFAEPVDPEELPDYHDVIDHPMDFSTVRKKLANGSYTTLGQFESDVFLICSNAMQYNAPETIYHKQARSIQELGRKKFEKLKIGFERSQMELKSEQKAGSNYLVKKQPKKPLACVSQEPVGSDFSSGATLATVADIQPTSYPMQVGRCERPGNTDGILEANAFWIDANQEKSEDVLSGKGLVSKWGRKSFGLDESRRTSYNQPFARSDSIFMTFDSEMKQLVAVGIHAEYSYARSLARFSASLGPIAWKIASHRIQKVLPAGCKFGRGWVGEYERLPTPIVMVNDRVQKDTSLVMKLQSTTELPKGDRNCKNAEPRIEHPVNRQVLEGKHPTVPNSQGNPFFGSAGVRLILNQEQNVQSRKLGKSENKGLKQVELNSLPSSNQNNDGLVAKFPSNTPAAESKPREVMPRSLEAFKQLDGNGAIGGEFPNGKVTNTSLKTQVTGPSPESTSNQSNIAAPVVVHGQEQSLGDPVQLMRMFAERAQKQQTSSNQSLVDTPPVTLSGQSGQRDDSGNAAAAAARAWMSVGAGGFKQGRDNSCSSPNQISVDSLYNSTREFHQHISSIRGEFPSGGMPFQPFQALASQPIHTGAVSQVSNRPTVFPQLTSSDQSRFQMQSPWRGLSPRTQSRQKQETLPPDLNIGFQSPGSPAKQSSGVLVDSQQPDLALQL
ncbi:hypothetical protein Fmac_027048 [Flemingia macrophylla]|uniref:Bromo domain-containing protein n=1 Tax=Flemingia macrophylla TaxID=520843 RepID=A0ABD1LGM9_9FABA